MKIARIAALACAGVFGGAVSCAVMYAVLYLAMVGRVVENDWAISPAYFFFGEKACGFFSLAHGIDRKIRKNYWENHHVSEDGTQDPWR